MSAAPPPQDPRRRPQRADPRGSILAEALRRGNTREAIAALRAKTGLGFTQAQDAVAGHERRPRERAGNLSPGEVPRRTGLGRAVFFLLLLAALGYAYFGGRS